MAKLLRPPKTRIPQSCTQQILFLSECSDREFIERIQHLQGDWPWLKMDMLHWLRVLNRMDDILQSSDTDLIKHSLILTRLLWENTTNRTVYSSFENLIKLLQTNDLDLLLLLLKLMLKPAQRISGLRSLKNTLNQAIGRLLVLAKQPSHHFQFYPPGSSQSVSVVADSRDYLPVFDKVVEAHTVPEDARFELLHMLRFNALYSDPEFKHKLDLVRYFSLAILGAFANTGNLLSEDVALNKLFLGEPDLIQHLCSAVTADKQQSEMNFALLSAIESLAHYRNRLSETLSALNVGANHGILMQLMRQIVANFDSQDAGQFTQDLIECVLSLFSFFLNTPAGGPMVVASGIVPLLTSALSSSSATHMKNVAKCVTILDNIIYGFPQALVIFTGAHGVDFIVERIQREVDRVMLLAPEFTPEELGPYQILDPGKHKKHRDLLAEVPLLRAILKLVLHTMQSSGSADGMRNLIDTSLPKSILVIFEYSSLFSHAGSFGLAVNIMSTFIHNEPTSLAILQELGLPAAFLQAAQLELPISAEVISAFPNAFGAICLNSAGLEAFTKQNPMDNFLSTFTKQDHLGTLLDNDVPSLIGNSVDEFMRHHPSLKENCMKSIIKMIQEVLNSFQELSPVEYENARLISQYETSNLAAQVKAQDSRAGMYVDVVCRFLEGLFQNVSHVKDFISSGGIEPLLKMFTAECLPYDFAECPSAYSLAYLFRSLVESNAADTAALWNVYFKTGLSKVQPLTAHDGKEPLLYTCAVNARSESKDAQVSYSTDEIFHGLVTNSCYIRLLADVYCSHSLSQSKSVHSIVNMFQPGVLEQLDNLRRVCYSEEIWLESLTPADWREKIDDDDLGGANVKPTTDEQGRPISSPDALVSPMDTTAPTTISPPLRQNQSASARNCRFFWHLTHEIVGDTESLFSGVVKMLCAKRLSESSYHRASVLEIVDRIGKIMSDQLDVFSIESVHQQKVLMNNIDFVHSLITEDRSAIILQTIQLVAFLKAGGLEKLFARLDDCLNLYTQVMQTEDTLSRKEYLISITDSVRLILSIFKTITDSSLLHDSTHTSTLQSRQRDKSKPDYFDPYAHLVKLRYLILKQVDKVWNFEHLPLFPSAIIKLVTSLITQILKTKGEVNNSPESQPAASSSGSSLAASIFGTMRIPVPVAPNEAAVAQLCDMGFSRTAAERVLVRCNNNLALAADYLLSHPEAAYPVTSSTSTRPTTAAESLTPAQPTQSTATEPSSSSAVEPTRDVSMSPEIPSAESAISEEASAESKKSADSDDMKVDEPGATAAPDFPALLEELRQKFSQSVTERALQILDRAEPIVVFSIKDLVCLVNKGNFAKTFSDMCSKLEQLIASCISSDDFKNASLSVRLHLALLAANDMTMKSFALEGLRSLCPSLERLVTVAASKKVAKNWLSSALMLMDTYVCLTTRLIESPLEPGTVTVPKFEKDEHFTTESHRRITEVIITFLSSKLLEGDEIHACLHMLVLLTRSYDIASYFMSINGPMALLDTDQIGLFTGQHKFIMMILRNCAESDQVLRDAMEKEISLCASKPRTRPLDFTALFKSTGQMCLREPAIYVQTIVKKIKLSKCDLDRKQFVLSFISDENKPDAEEGVYPAPSFSEDKLSSEFGKVVQAMVSQLINFRQRGKDLKANTQTAPENIRAMSDRSVHLRRCLILQCLSELAVSYNLVKYDFFNATQRKTVKGATKATHFKNSLINHLLYDLLPRPLVDDTKQKNEAGYKEKLAESSWAACLICALSVSRYVESSPAVESDCNHMRRIVLDHIAKCIKDTRCQVTIENRFSKLVSLCELCFLLLSPKTLKGEDSANKSSELKKESSSIKMAKIMIEKGFPALLTGVIADMDIHNPQSKAVVEAVLKPLEILAEAAVTLGKVEGPSALLQTPRSNRKPRSDPVAFDTALDELAHQEEPTSTEISDMYRNSALGVLNPVSDNEMSITGDSDNETDPEAYDVDSDDDEDMDEVIVMMQGSDEEDEMEIVVPQPYHGHDMEHEESSEGEEDEVAEIEIVAEPGECINADNASENEGENEGEEMWESESDVQDPPRVAAGQQDENEFSEEDEEGEEIDDDDDENQEDIDMDDMDEMIEIADFEAENLLFTDRSAAHRRGRRLDAGGSRPRGVELHWTETTETNEDFQSFARPISLANRNGPQFLDRHPHPLLHEEQRRDDANPFVVTGTRALNRGLSDNRRDEGIGAHARQMLEQIFSRTLNRPQEITIPIDGGTGSVYLRRTAGGNNTTASFTRRPGQAVGSSANAEGRNQGADGDTESPEEIQLKVLHYSHLSFTEERWRHAAQLLYGAYNSEEASKVTNDILNVLVPPALEEERIRKEEEMAKREADRAKREEEERKRAEERERKEKEDEERKQQELAERAQQEQANPMANEVAAEAPAEPARPAEEEPVIVTINGEQVDISGKLSDVGTGIDVTFLEALPDDLRMEVLNQHFRERAQANLEPLPSSTISQDFLDALPFEIREEIVRQERAEAERRAREAATDAAERPETNAFDPQSLLRQFEEAINASVPPMMARRTPQVNVKKPAAKDTIQIVDKSGIFSLLRLLFVPEPFVKDMLHELIAKLSENVKTRAEVLCVLISVLEDGCHDLSLVDKGLSELSLKPPTERKYRLTKDAASEVVDEMKETPNLVAQRCLDTLIYLVNSGPSSNRFFLTEGDSELAKTPKSSKKGKEKASPTTYIPAVTLLKLLERPSFLRNSLILEQLTSLVSSVLRPLAMIAKKKHAQAESKKAEAEETKEAAAPEPKEAKNPAFETPVKTEREKDKPDIKLPYIPSSHVHNAVNVLKDGVCSLKTFQNTLHVIQYLSSYPENRLIITDQLLQSSQEVGNSIPAQLSQLIEEMNKVESSVDMNGDVLSSYTSQSAAQSKLLRLLKTIDFLHKVAMEEAGASSSNTELNQHLRSQYDMLQFKPLWQKLSDCMTVIGEKEGMIHVATVLLPLIEAFMVVSKPFVSDKNTIQPSGHSMSRHPSEQPEDDVSFISFTEQHRKILNTMVRNSPSLMNGSFSLLVQNPKILEFDNKRTYFNQQLHKKKNKEREYGSLQVNVRRQYVFEDSFHQLQGRSGDEIKYSKLNVRFHEEEGVDAGGVAREWFSVLARQMFNPNYALFRPSAADKVTYQPNRASGINPDHLSYFKFVGRIIGKAIYDGRLMDAYFTRSFYKCIIGTQVDYKDIEAVDPEFHKSLEWILQNDITDILDLTFSIELDDFGKHRIVDLKPDGRSIPVTEENKVEYVRLVTEQRLVVAIKDQIKAFLSGFHEVIPRELVKIFNEQELELLISGMPDIDIDDWKNNTEYQNYTPSSPQIQWFWRAVRSFSQEERAKLIQFVTGTSKVPLEGFAQLQGSSGVQKFQIHKEFSSTSRLPSAHTCFNQIDLPQYESYEQLRQQLLLAISECGTGNFFDSGFGFA